ncbi:MAG: metallophosphoesterase [Bacilli bacterium]|nr:metallophosphoesterase [Bacilli bacterium]
MKHQKVLITSILTFLAFSLTGCQFFGSSGNEGGNTKPEGTLSLDIYASNDFHGAVEYSSSSMGIELFGTYMKMKGEEENTLLLDQGDTWQGSIYSNYNHGAMITEVMAAAHFDARTVGNHDFDWGIEPLKANTRRSYKGYTVPTLAANVYDYDFDNKIEGNIQQSDIGVSSIISTLENGLKVGVVGIIGQHQITSITTTNVKDVCFKEHISIIKQEATSLREKGADIVIASCHTGQEDLMYNGLENYIDLALCGHTHQAQQGREGNLHYAQFGSYGEMIGKVHLDYNTKTKKVTNTQISEIYTNEVATYAKEIDADIANIVSTYNSECEAAASEVVATNADYFPTSDEAVNLMCKAIFDQCEIENQDVIFSYCNTARHYLPQTYSNRPWTYATLYQSFPFDNIVYIIDVTGSDIVREVYRYNNVCFNPTFNYQIDPNETYRIACIDYLAYHTNDYRVFDYFPSFSGQAVDQLDDNYRVILKNWLIRNGYNSGRYLYASDFSSSNDSFNKNLFQNI